MDVHIYTQQNIKGQHIAQPTSIFKYLYIMCVLCICATCTMCNLVHLTVKANSCL